jgi:hypothetical protein
MYWGVVVFESLCWIVFVSMLGGFAYNSYRKGRIVPDLWMMLGIFAMSWLESPYDNAMYAQFHPDFHRLPAWGPIGMTQGQLPLISPPGYIMYFLLPALLASAIANWLIKRTNWSRARTLLTVGLVVGLVWDGLIEGLQAQYLHLWVFSRTVPGLNISSDIGLYPVYCALAMGTFIMAATYLIGNLTKDGDSVIDAWARSQATSPGATRALQAVGYIAFCNLVYASAYLPMAITKYGGMMTQTGVLVPYPGEIAMQPESAAPQDNGALGAVIMWGLLVTAVLIYAVWAKRMDRKYIQPTFTHPSALLAESEPAAIR